MTKTRKTYRYTIELTEPMYPRTLADCMQMQGNLARTLLSVTDLQRSDHTYGSTYQTHLACEPPASTSETAYSWVLGYYAVLRSQATGTPEHDAYDWILDLLKQGWVPGNMGMLTSYLNEWSIIFETFRAYCEMIGKFTDEETDVKTEQGNGLL